MRWPCKKKTRSPTSMTIHFQKSMPEIANTPAWKKMNALRYANKRVLRHNKRIAPHSTISVDTIKGKFIHSSCSDIETMVDG